MLLNQLYFSYRRSLENSQDIVIRNASEAWATVDQCYDGILSARSQIFTPLPNRNSV
ncbi:hypothetical protein BVRB_030540 [Beta vulgaris subsp. vulgaris]|uniref:Uncharacterized protein n=1 Tax=Beta vulgaris subsp. vulgaris TaxID=3555 RepID=A0A0J8AXS6_BETVV|nr:hypothetical protein BVRB_030540 [Beta vulgaris subsp. vulgaris]